MEDVIKYFFPKQETLLPAPHLPTSSIAYRCVAFAVRTPYPTIVVEFFL
jgi:hypothetical protein